ncbi:hypothetical protein EG829_01460 [bacterium]|nr:hypothetical protein [bacterium]
MNYKKFTVCALSAILFFVVMNFAIWKCCTEVLLTKKYDGGDLARMSYALGSKQTRKMVTDLPCRHITMKEYDGRKVDVLTIGDSFSMGGGEGLNSHYQDYIATINNCSVLNVYPYPTDDKVAGFAPISTLAVLMNSGYLDKIKPRYILIESVVRYCIHRYAKKLDLNATDTPERIRRYYAETTYKLDYLPKIGFINDGNFKFLYFNMLYLFSDSATKGRVYRRELSRSLFNVRNDKELIFFYEDLMMLPYMNSRMVGGVNDTFNQLADVLDKKGIKLYFMPIVDKYDLYQEDIVDNPYQENRFFDELRKLPKRYTLIDTKAILQPLVRAGEKDVFFADDSHWTWKASKQVFETVRFP